jgi:catechol 2,3-dioxygenase-like lactoylglutathione lyase family enzyme
MFDHVTIRVSDRAAYQRFYATVLRALGIEASAGTDELAEWHDFSLAPANAARPVAPGGRFYLTVAPYTRFQLNHDRPELTQFRATSGPSRNSRPEMTHVDHGHAAHCLGLRPRHRLCLATT